MEAMMLSTPVGSTSPQIHSSTNTYYPAYLMGEPNTGRLPPSSISPGRPRPFVSTTATSIASPSSHCFPRENIFTTSRLGADRQSGPPTLSLMEGLMQSPSRQHPYHEHQKLMRMMPQQQDQNYDSTHLNTSDSLSALCHSPLLETPGSPNELKAEASNLNSSIAFNSPAREPLETTWVTVYGFPVASASFILTHFAQLGTIIDQRQPSSGNWMHLKYQTKLQVRKALTMNSKIINGNIMVGVFPSHDLANVVERENLLNSSSVSPNLAGTPKSLIRPLTQAYEASRVDFESLQQILKNFLIGGKRIQLLQCLTHSRSQVLIN